jgi:hypothetical protein
MKTLRNRLQVLRSLLPSIDIVSVQLVESIKVVDEIIETLDNALPEMKTEYPQTIGEMMNLLSNYNPNDRICIQSLDEDGDANGDLHAIFLDDDYEGVSLPDGTTGREIRFCPVVQEEPEPIFTYTGIEVNGIKNGTMVKLVWGDRDRVLFSPEHEVKDLKEDGSCTFHNKCDYCAGNISEINIDNLPNEDGKFNYVLLTEENV